MNKICAIVKTIWFILTSPIISLYREITKITFENLIDFFKFLGVFSIVLVGTLVMMFTPFAVIFLPLLKSPMNITDKHFNIKNLFIIACIWYIMFIPVMLYCKNIADVFNFIIVITVVGFVFIPCICIMYIPNFVKMKNRIISEYKFYYGQCSGAEDDK